MATSNVRVLGRVYKIKRLKRMKDAGNCDYVKAELRVSANQDDLEQKDALLHEVMHAIRYQQGREYGGEVEEDYVRSLATGLIAVLQDNPDFAAWLGQPVKESHD